MDEFRRQRLAELLEPNDDPFERAAMRTRRSVMPADGRREGGDVLGRMDNVVRQIARGTPFGSFMDEFAATADAVTHPILGRGSSADTFGQRYAENVSQERARDEAFEKSNPAAAFGLQLGGALLSAPTAPSLAIMKGATLWPKIVNAAATGLGYGTIYGAGEGEGADRLKTLPGGLELAPESARPCLSSPGESPTSSGMSPTCPRMFCGVGSWPTHPWPMPSQLRAPIMGPILLTLLSATHAPARYAGKPPYLRLR